MPVTRLVARPDDSQLAYSHAGRLGLLDAAMHELAAIDLARDPRWLGFVGGQLAALDGDELVAYDLPGLGEATRCALPAGSNVRAIVGERVVLDAGGLEATVARFLGKKIDRSSFTMKLPAQHVLAQEEHRVLVVNPQATELLDTVSKRVSSRVQLPLPPAPREVGATHQLRYVWTFRPGRHELFIVRLSDGRPFQQLMDAPITAVLASVNGPWVVVCTEAGPRRLHVQTLAVHALDADVAQAACVTGGAEPSLYWIDRMMRVQRTHLGGQAVVGDGRVGGGGLRMEIEPVGTVGGPKHAPTATPAATPATATAPALAPAAAPVPAVSVSTPWRLLLAEWAKQVMQGKDVTPPAVDRTMADVVRRAALSVEGGRLLMLLYGAWVAGEPRVALAVAARTIAWEEVAGDATVPRSRLTDVVDGRVRVKPVVARYLDGAHPERVVVYGRTPRPDVAPGRQLARVSADLPVMASARGLAERMGAAAIIDEVRAASASELADAVDEAWLRGLPIVAVPGLELDARRLAAVPLRADHALVIVWPDDAAPVALEELPTIEA